MRGDLYSSAAAICHLEVLIRAVMGDDAMMEIKEHGLYSWSTILNAHVHAYLNDGTDGINCEKTSCV